MDVQLKRGLLEVCVLSAIIVGEIERISNLQGALTAESPSQICSLLMG